MLATTKATETGTGADVTSPEPVKNRALPLVRRQRLALIVAAACAVLSTAGLVATLLVKSPQQLLADTAAPTGSVVTAEVQRRPLASTVVTRATVAASATIEITPIVPAAAAQVVTSVQIKAGDVVQPGQVLVAVSARPLIVLPGAVPAYRDLKPGDTGEDVKQLQAALSSLGYPTSPDRSGYFGPKTKTAVRGLYAKKGYDPPDTGGVGAKGDLTALRAADAAVVAAQDAVDAIRRRIAAGETAGPAEQPLPQQRGRLDAALVDARAARADLVASTGTMLPLAEFVFVPAFPARVMTFAAKVGDAVKAPLITLASGPLSVRVKLRPDQAAAVKVGMPVKLFSDTLGADADGKVTGIGEVTTDTTPAEGPGGAPTASQPYQPIVVTTDKPLPDQWSGQDVRVSITSAQTDAAVLVVALSAVSAGADGKTTVSVLDAAGQIQRVDVTAGVSGDGFVEVTAVHSDLHEGDKVVVSAQP